MPTCYTGARHWSFADLTTQLTGNSKDVQVTVNEKEVAVLRYDLGDNTSFELELDIARGCVPPRVELAYDSVSGRRIRELVETRWQKVKLGPADQFVWFPRQVTYRRWEGQELWYHENLAVNQVALNTTLDSSLFTCKGKNIPRGYVVARGEDRSDVVEWDGSSFEPWTPVPLREKLRPGRLPSRRRNYAIIAVNVVVALVLAYLALRKTIRRSV